MQQIAVVGLGNFGYYLGRELFSRGFDVIGIDIEKSMVQRVRYDLSEAVLADATEKETLLALGIDRVDIGVVTIGSNMLASIIATFHLKEIGVKWVYAKALNVEHAQILQRMGADEVLFPEKELAVSLARRIHNPNMLEYLPFLEDHGIFELEAPKDFWEKCLRELDLINRYHIQIIAVRDRISNSLLFIPKADYVIRETDELIILGSHQNTRMLMNKFGIEEKK
jgi:trk system potassium uptake protein TrkA